MRPLLIGRMSSKAGKLQRLAPAACAREVLGGDRFVDTAVKRPEDSCFNPAIG